MMVTLMGIVTLVRLVLLANAFCPMLVTLVPIVTLARLVQEPNAPFPMLVTLLGIVTPVRLDAVVERIVSDVGDIGES